MINRPAKLTEAEERASLRQRAEERFRERVTETSKTPSPAETTRLLHELQVHQIELEMQNEELRRTQEELEAERERYFDLYDLAPVGYLTIDANRQITEVNLTAATMLGVGRNELFHKPLSQFVSPEDQSSYYLGSKRLFDSGEMQNWDITLVRGDGFMFSANIQGRSTHTGEYRITFQDCSERILAEESRSLIAAELSREKVLLRGLIDSISDLIFIKDHDGVYLACNKATVAFTGVPETDQIGRSDFDLFDHKTAQFIAAKDREVLGSGKSVQTEEWMTSHDGSIVLLDMLKSPIFGSDGHVHGLVGIGRDITERKRIEEELIRSREAAQVATIAKSQFLATMSHEIRTPMNGVTTILDLLLHSGLTPKQREYVELAKKSGSDLIYLLSDILDLSKIEADRLELEISTFELRPVIADIVGMLSPEAGGKGLELVSSIDSDVPEVFKGDRGRLRQILTNLISNAVKFTHKGSVTLHIENVSTEGESATLRFLVRDSGIGIPADKLEQIFETFTQADSSTTRKYGGTGLGLAICKRLTELLGGSIGVESSEGEGSTFWFTVVMEKQTERRDVKSRVFQPDRTNRRDISTRPDAANRILLTEDDPTARKILPLLLENCGYRVDVAKDGMEALLALENNDYALVLMDCMMPEMSGYQVTTVIRNPASAVRRHDIPVIALTGNASQEDRDRCLAVGMNEHLPKPLIFDDLLALLQNLLVK
jgi:PAS domain S-box-containing protein